MTFTPQCKTKADLHREMARVLRMCKEAGFDRPWECVRYMGMSGPQRDFDGDLTQYEFSLAFIEGRPVFRGDVLQAMGIPVTVAQSIGGRIILADGTRIDADALSWNPPQRTIEINGVRPISLDEFFAKELASLLRFKKQWEENHLANPDSFPMKLSPGEWDEQLRAREN